MNLKKCPIEFIKFAHLLSDKSESLILKYFRTKLKIKSKADNSPVTIADTESELLIRKLITTNYPNHGIISEEHSDLNPNAEFVWVIDPIDGTRSFIAGHKDFGTLIALLYKNIPILGIINCPAHKERWQGIINKKTYLNGKVTSTSKINNLNKCYSFSSGLYFEDPNFKKLYDKLIKKVKYYRFGGDCYMYGMLASGFIDIVVEDTLKIHDYMALIPIIEGAGGKVSDRYGKKITINSKGSFVGSCSQNIHKQVIKILNS